LRHVIGTNDWWEGRGPNLYVANKRARLKRSGRSIQPVMCKMAFTPCVCVLVLR
jgi:hypothetical protein